MVDLSYSCTVCSHDFLYVCSELKQVGMGFSDLVLQLVEPFKIVVGPAEIWRHRPPMSR